MPSTLRTNSYEADTPPHTRPSSSASSSASSGCNLRATSMDSIPPMGDKLEHIPTRTTGTAPKPNARAMQFVKTGPAQLYKKAAEQIKISQSSKALRKQAVKEEDEPDWQQNLDKWKMSRRKRNENVLERVIEVKKFENEVSQNRRKSKTFSEMREDTTKRGRRYNLVVHDDDDSNDLSGLGLSNSNNNNAGSPDSELSKSTEMTKSIEIITEKPPTKPDAILDTDNKDAKSDAGFCTGSDTGSDGALDNISDTSSAMGDKKDQQDSLEGVPITKHEENDSITVTKSITKQEYTYDSAIQGYKQYAENTARKLNSSMTNLSNLSNVTTFDSKPSKIGKINDKLSFFSKEVDKFNSTSTSSQNLNNVVLRQKSPVKVDISKRRTMFELSNHTQSTMNLSNYDSNISSKLSRGKSTDFCSSTGNLKNRVQSFERLDYEPNSYKAVTPQRDSKFKEKLATFKSIGDEQPTLSQKVAPPKDKNFFKKLSSFSSIENSNSSINRLPLSTKPNDNKSSLKYKIASFEQLEDSNPSFQLSEQKSSSVREKSVSMESLSKPVQRKFESKLANFHSEELFEETSAPKLTEKPVRSWRSEVEIPALAMPKTTAPTPPISSSSPPPPISTSSPRGGELFYDDVISSSDKCSEPLYRTSDIAPAVSATSNAYNLQYSDDDINEVIETSERNEVKKEVIPTIYTQKFIPEDRFQATNKEPEKQPTTEVLVLEEHEWLKPSVSTNLLPPSEPPPPPPPCDSSEGEEDQPPTAGALILPPVTSPTPSDSFSETYPSSESSSRNSTRDEIRKRRSNFLGTTQLNDDASSASMDSMIKMQQKEAEQRMMEARKSLQKTTAQALSDIEQSRSKYQSSGMDSLATRGRYTWEDRLRDDTTTHGSTNLNETDDGYGYQNKGSTKVSTDSEHQTTISQHSISVHTNSDSYINSARTNSELHESLDFLEPNVTNEHLDNSNSIGNVSDGIKPKTAECDDSSQVDESLGYLEYNEEADTLTSLRNSDALEIESSKSTKVDTVDSTDSAMSSITVPPSSLTVDSDSSHYSDARSSPIVERKVRPTAAKNSELSLGDEGVDSSNTLNTDRSSIHKTDHSNTDPHHSSDIGHPQSNKTLAELEFEMIQHDRNVLSRTISQSTTVVKGEKERNSKPSSLYEEIGDNQPIYEQVAEGCAYQKDPQLQGPEKPQRSYNTIYDSVSQSNKLPEPRPRSTKKMPKALPEEENKYEVIGAPSLHPKSDLLTHQSRSALAATPRHRLTEGESWIKRKPQPNRDINKHWLLQEAEQRRLEQRPITRQDRGVTSSVASGNTTSHINILTETATNSAATHTNRLTETANEPVDNSSPIVQYSPAMDINRNNNQRVLSEPVNRTSESVVWRNQATTYQPLASEVSAPQTEKPLPDAIINTLTQRVQSKSRSSSANNSSGRPSPFSGSMTGSNCNLHTHQQNNNTYNTPQDEDYHDYMNAEAINQHSQQVYNNNQQIYANQPQVQQPSPPNNTYDLPYNSPLANSNSPYSDNSPHNSPHNSPSKDDQNLVSVSGKKKCSHCGEELGRGAAMIIESLRLFYHIPCFVCCVCGIQLGNGEAGADVRVRNHALHCQNCYSNDKGMKFSEV